MPQHPTLSLSNFLNSATSSSRKRSHAEITRSQSRSRSPDLPPKRRRISRSLNSSLFSSSSPTPTPTPASTSTSTAARTRRDGYDYRRPVMSSNPTRPSPARNDLTIDLTADSDNDTDNDSVTNTHISSDTDVPPRRATRPNSQPHFAGGRNAGAPPFGQGSRHETREVIDLSDDDSDYQAGVFGRGTDLVSDDESDTGSDSADVQILHERPAPPGNRRPPQPARPSSRRPPPQHSDRGPWVNLPDMLRRGTQFMLGNVQNVNEVLLDRLDGLRARVGEARQEPDLGEDDAGNFIINLDYRQPAFALGGLEIYDRSSETPQVVDEPYKAPPAPKEGFIRTFAEEDVVLCPMCGDELATGKDDTKQQVWVVKQCGHVYCGECATNRFASKAKRKDKRASSSKVAPFAECKVDGCKIRLTHNTAMFPIYL